MRRPCAWGPRPSAAARLRLSPPDAQGHGVLLSVEDDGPGIPPDIRDRLFDPFCTTKPGGSGLGLAIVHRAIEAHRGVVFTDRADGRTRFTVLLPSTSDGDSA